MLYDCMQVFMEEARRVQADSIRLDTDTDMELISKLYPNLEIGGTGFFWKDAPNLPYEIEHHMPDYHLYDGW